MLFSGLYSFYLGGDMNKDTWVVVANSTQARIFKAGTARNLKEVEALVHPESRLHEGDIIADKAGCSSDGVCDGRSAWEQETSPKRREMINFAKELTHHLEDARNHDEFGKLYIAASPAFLGQIRHEMSGPLTQYLAGEVDKDITHLQPKEIREYFPYVL